MKQMEQTSRTAPTVMITKANAAKTVETNIETAALSQITTNYNAVIMALTNGVTAKTSSVTALMALTVGGSAAILAWISMATAVRSMTA